MQKILVIGAGVSGLSVASILKDEGYDVSVVERSSSVGGLVKCTVHDGVLFHRVGGHVFNAKNDRVDNWFWSKFDKSSEFISSKRNAQIYIDNMTLDYPIENNIYRFPLDVMNSIVGELLDVYKGRDSNPLNFKDFLLDKFGKTLCDIYFFPYNKKLWGVPLEQMPLPWLNGKLPMPKVMDIFVSNIGKLDERQMVHSSFYYPKHGGSQFIVDRLSDGLDIKLNHSINSIRLTSKGIDVDGVFYNQVIYTGDVRCLNKLITDVDDLLLKQLNKTKNFPSNSTTNVLCEVLEPIDFSWLYFPESKFAFHRVINTGSFSPNNSPSDMFGSCVVEFSGIFDEDFVYQNLKYLPFKVKPIAMNCERDSYIIHSHEVSNVMFDLKSILSDNNFSLLGRFAEWEYYNMDKAIEASFQLVDKINAKIKC